MLSYLQAKYDAMMQFHHAHYEVALDLQATLRNDVLCELAEEHHLDDHGVSRAREWIDDYGKSTVLVVADDGHSHDAQ